MYIKNVAVKSFHCTILQQPTSESFKKDHSTLQYVKGNSAMCMHGQVILLADMFTLKHYQKLAENIFKFCHPPQESKMLEISCESSARRPFK